MLPLHPSSSMRLTLEGEDVSEGLVKERIACFSHEEEKTETGTPAPTGPPRDS